MRRLIVASVATLLLVLAQCATADDQSSGNYQANVESIRSSPVGADSTNLPAGTTCQPTAPPLVVTPANIFQGYFCSNSAWGVASATRCFMYHYDSTIKNGGRWTMKYKSETSRSEDCFPEQPVKVFQTIRETYVVTINGEYEATQKKVETYVLGFNASRGVSGSIYKLPKYGNAEGITVNPSNFTVIFGRGDHKNPENGLTGTSMECIYGMTGESVWTSWFIATSYFAKPIFYEEHIYTMVGAGLYRIPSSTGEWKFTEPYYESNPCGFDNSVLKGRVNLTLVAMGYETDAAGNTQELSALLLYSNSPTTKQDTAHFSLCRVHHSGNSFGGTDGLWISTDETRTVNAITGGGNTTFVTFQDKQADFWAFNTSNYGDKTTKPDIFRMTRESVNRFSGAMVLYQKNARYQQTEGPIVVHAMGTTLNAYDLRTKQMAWSIPNRPCIWTPTPTNARRAAICVGATHEGSENPSFAVDYNGNILWESSIGSSFSAIDAGEVEAFFSSQSGILGVDPIKGVPPSPAPKEEGTSAGVIILAIFLIAFSVIALAGIARFVFGRRGAAYNKTSASPNRAEGEGGKPTLSTRSMHDVEAGAGSEGKPLNEGAGYGGLN